MTKILWFTGLSGVGKSTLSKILGIKLTKLSFKVKIIDGDIFRTKNKNKNNFSKTNILKNNLSIINYIKKIKIKKIQKTISFVKTQSVSSILNT